jgi:hypothetical protein
VVQKNFELTPQLSKRYNAPKGVRREMNGDSHKTEQRNKLVVEIIGTLNLRFKKLNLCYEAGWTDSFCHRRCQHEHPTRLEAAKCGMPHGAGWYVLAVENGTPRQLLDSEEDVVNKFRFGAR